MKNNESHTLTYIEWGDASYSGHEIRLKMKEKSDGSFRVIEQTRFVVDFLNFGKFIPLTIRWRNGSIKREYATKKEAEALLEAFNAKVEKGIYDTVVAHIPAKDRERYAKEKKLKIPHP